MKDAFSTFQHLMDQAQAEWFKIPTEEINRKPTQKKWSKKEILGHLIDSAVNNISRLVRGQFEALEIQNYDQDKWVEVQNYQGQQGDEIFRTWSMLNSHLLNVARNIRESDWERICTLEDGKLVTLRWLYYDYIAHMKHHLKQIFGETVDL